MQDFIIRIKNGIKANKLEIIVPKKKIFLNILDLLIREGFIRGYKFDENRPYEILVLLKYYRGKSTIQKIVPFRKKTYVNVNFLWKIETYKNNLGCFLLSTNKGILTAEEARLLNVGGELILYVI